MRTPASARPYALALVTLCAACAGSRPRVDDPVARPTARAEVPPPPQHPFAKTSFEAQMMIRQEIHTRMKALWACVDDYRSRVGERHRGVIVDIGIDQEGGLLGVIAVEAGGRELEPALKDCLMRGLRGAAFPRSHAGVITVRQMFQDAGWERK